MVRYIITYNDGLLEREEEPALYRLGIGRGMHKPVEWVQWRHLGVFFCTQEAAQATIDFMSNVIDGELEGKLHIRTLLD